MATLTERLESLKGRLYHAEAEVLIPEAISEIGRLTAKLEECAMLYALRTAELHKITTLLQQTRIYVDRMAIQVGVGRGDEWQHRRLLDEIDAALGVARLGGAGETKEG